MLTTFAPLLCGCWSDFLGTSPFAQTIRGCLPGRIEAGPSVRRKLKCKEKRLSMNLAMEMLRNRAAQLYDAIAGESNIELLIDPIEEPSTQATDRVKANCTILPCTEDTQRVADGLMRCNNVPSDPCFAHLKWTFERQGKLKVWIYNISHREYVLGNSMVKNLPVPACPEDTEYAVVTSLPAVMIYPKDNVDNNSVDYILFDGRRVAMDLIDPSNFSTDQDANFDWARRLSVGNNFSLRGVFFSTHNPPLKKELKAAHKRLKKYYTDLMEKAELLERVNFIGFAADKMGVAPAEIKAAQQYVEDSNGNK